MVQAAGNTLYSSEKGQKTPTGPRSVKRRGPVDRFFRASGRFIFEVAKVIFIALIIIVPVRIFIFQPFQVNGSSMLPNFEDRDYLIVDEISYRFSEPERGDVIVFRYPNDRTQFFIKRIIGLPGETVSIEGGKVFVTTGDQKLAINESIYLASTNDVTEGALEVVLGDEEYFVLGDNRDASSDSRSWGPLMHDDIIGRAWVRAWPFDRANKIQEPKYDLTPVTTNP